MTCKSFFYNKRAVNYCFDSTHNSHTTSDRDREEEPLLAEERSTPNAKMMIINSIPQAKRSRRRSLLSLENIETDQSFHAIAEDQLKIFFLGD